MSTRPTKRPLRVPGILFAMAAYLLAVSLAEMVDGRLQLAQAYAPLPIIIGAAVAGLGTSLYAGYRGGMHALVGSMLSIPLLALLVIPGMWQLAIFAGAVCALAAAVAEKVMLMRAVNGRRPQ